MKNKGITLIALIVTVIIMLILVSVSINLILDGGIIEKTRYATGRMQEEMDKETNQLEKAANSNYFSGNYTFNYSSTNSTVVGNDDDDDDYDDIVPILNTTNNDVGSGKVNLGPYNVFGTSLSYFYNASNYQEYVSENPGTFNIQPYLNSGRGKAYFVAADHGNSSEDIEEFRRLTTMDQVRTLKQAHGLSDEIYEIGKDMVDDVKLSVVLDNNKAYIIWELYGEYIWVEEFDIINRDGQRIDLDTSSISNEVFSDYIIYTDSYSIYVVAFG